MRRSLVLILVLLASHEAVAEQQLSLFQKMELRDACGAELTALCGDAGSGQGQRAQCVKAKFEALSEGCRQTIAKLRADLASTSP